MKPKLSQIAVILAAILSAVQLADAQTQNVPTRITQKVDERQLVVLRGNTHPLARAEYDQGAVMDAQPLRRMLLLLQRSSEQEAALRQLLDEQQDKSSPQYHKWRTPEEFGKQFGPADADTRMVTQWLTSQGFTDIKVGPGRTVIEFSGNAGQVRSAFHTEIHRFVVQGEEHLANASDPQIPTALAPVVAGVVSLHNFPMKSHMHRLGTFQRSKTGAIEPLFTFPACRSGTCYAVGPPDFATIYNTAPLLSGTPKIDGSGQTIAIVGESNINVQDVIDFRTIFGLPQNFSAINIILNGADPGINVTEGESDLDIQWAGAVAPGATVDFVTSAPTETTSGIHLSALYIVDNNLAGVMSESFGNCEQNLGTALNQFYNSLWEQAAAQGITVMLSAGDGGSAGCDNFASQQTATRGLGVSGLASTPFNVAVGGTDFDQVGREAQFWNTNTTSAVPPVPGSALSYIPELTWNDSCAQNGLNGCSSGNLLNIVAGSGGASTIYPKPLWQSGPGVPMDNHRDLPDVSLFASNGFNDSFYIMCERDITGTSSCNLTSFPFTFQGVGGTSVAAPAFAGIMALVNQKQATSQNPAPRQGNANYVLYALARKQVAANLNCNSSTGPASGCTLNDVTKGNNAVPCSGGTLNCSSNVAGVNGVLVEPASPTTPAFPASSGYDLASGLGSVNAQNLVNNWSSITFLPSATTLTASVNGTPVSSISVAHGTPIGVSSNVAAGSGASGTPTGQVAVVATPNPTPGNPSGSLGIEALSLTSGIATSNSVILPGGTYNLGAHYQGDGTFGPSDSSPAIPVSITAEASKTLISIPVFDPTTGKETGNTPTSIVYGSPYLARFDVGNASASLTFPEQPLCTPPNCPTGKITVTDSLNGGAPAALDAGTFALNSSGSAEDFAIQLLGGSHVLSASYSGDNSFNASSNTYALTVTPGATRILPPNPPMPPVVATPFNLGVILTMNFFGVMPSCNFTFYDGTTALQGTPTCNWQANGPFLYVSFPVAQTTAGTHTYTAKFNGDTNYGPSTSASMTTRVFYGTNTTLTFSPTTVQYGTSVTLTAVVDTTLLQGPAISNAVSFITGSGSPVSGTVTYTPTKDSAGNLALQATLTTTPQTSIYYNANFAGDTNYSSSGSNEVFVNVNIPDFSLSANLPNSSVTAGNSAIATITVTPASNSSSPVTLTCPPLNLLGQTQPPGISCSFSPSTVNLSNGTAAASTLTISTLAPSSGTTTGAVPLLPPPYLAARFFWPLPVVSLLALLPLFLISSRLPSNRLAFGAALVFCILVFLGFVGCGGGSSGGGGGGGPVPTSITLTASSVKVPSSPTSGGSVNLTANVTSPKTPGGTVTFIVDGNSGWFTTPSPVVSGVAQVQLTNLSVGIHTVSAQYSGDANNLASQTKGSLNIAVTGQTGISVQGHTGGLFHTIGVNFNLQ